MGLVALVAASALCALAAVPAGAAASHSSLAAWWPLDEGGGQMARDKSGHGLDGLLGSTPDVDGGDPAWVTGQVGPALHFGDGDLVLVGDSAELEPAELTAEAWVRRSGSPGLWAYIVSKGADGCEAASYGLYSGFTGGLSFYVYDGTAYKLASPDAGTDVWDGRWHHVAGTFDGELVRLFVDGVEVGSGTPAPRIRYGLPSGEAFYIGNYRGSCDRPFDGDIDDVRIWSRAFRPSEIPGLAGGGPPPTAGAMPSGAPAGTSGAVPAAPAAETILLRGVSAARRASYRKVARRGLRVAVNVGMADVQVRISAFYRGRLIGRSKPARSRRPGMIVLRVKLFRPRVERALRKHRRLSVTYSVRADGHGRSATAKRKLLLRR